MLQQLHSARTQLVFGFYCPYDDGCILVLESQRYFVNSIVYHISVRCALFLHRIAAKGQRLGFRNAVLVRGYGRNYIAGAVFYFVYNARKSLVFVYGRCGAAVFRFNGLSGGKHVARFLNADFAHGLGIAERYFRSPAIGYLKAFYLHAQNIGLYRGKLFYVHGTYRKIS